MASCLVLVAAGVPASPSIGSAQATGGVLAWSDPRVVFALILFVATVALSCFFSLAELAMVSVNKVRVNRLAEDGHRRARALVELFSDADVSYLTGLLITINILNIVAANITAWVVIRTGNHPYAAVAAAFQIMVTLAVAEIIPKTLAAHDPERYALRVALPIRSYVHSAFFRAGMAVVNAFSRLLQRLLGVAQIHRHPMVTEEELEVMTDVAEEEGVLDAHEAQMIDGIISIRARTAREIMISRIDVISLEAKTTVGEAADVIAREGKSRIPVFDGIRDNMVGVLYANDVLAWLSKGRDAAEVPVSELMRPAFAVPDSMRIDVLLNELQARKVHIALVIDEHGGFDGVVTIEDILEEIVGGIQDEHDDETEGIVPVAEDEWLVQAKVGRHEVEAALGIDLPEGDYDTIGGFLVTSLNTLPDPGEEVLYGGYAFIVKEVSGPRINTVIVRRLSPAEAYDREAEGTEVRSVEFESTEASPRALRRRPRQA